MFLCMRMWWAMTCTVWQVAARVGLLTLFFSVIGAPLSRRRVTMLRWPW